MSADTLRAAAKLMRERAEAATPGPWWSDDSDQCWRLHGVHAVIPAAMFPGTDEVMIPEQVMNHQILKAPKSGTPYAEYWPHEADAAQITSWHPLVALAVAEWLEGIAAHVADELYEATADAECCGTPGACSGHRGILTCNKCAEPFPEYCHCWDAPLKVARAYLGETS
jgi:hypothetical protein